MRIRRAGLADTEALAGLRWSWASEAAPPPLPWAEFLALFAGWQRAHEGTHRPFLAEDASGAALGMAWLASLPRVPDPAATQRVGGDLQSVYVLPEHRSSGVGKALVAAVLELFRAEGMEAITVSSSRGAVSLYERTGFAVSPQLLKQAREQPAS